MIDWTLDKGKSDLGNSDALGTDISNGWYTKERRIGLDSPALFHAITYITAGLGKFGFEKVESRLRQPLGLAMGRRPPLVLVFATERDGAVKFAEVDATQAAYVGGTEDGTDAAKGPYDALAGILFQWGVAVVADKMPPFHPAGTVAAQAADPVGELIKDGSGVHHEVSAAFVPGTWPLNEQYTRLLANGDYQVFQRTTFVAPGGFPSGGPTRPGWRRLR